MDSVTVSAKISEDIARRIVETGFSTSAVMQVGVQLFLNLTPQEQTILIESNLIRKKYQRAMKRYQSIKKLEIT